MLKLVTIGSELFKKLVDKENNIENRIIGKTGVGIDNRVYPHFFDFMKNL